MPSQCTSLLSQHAFIQMLKPPLHPAPFPHRHKQSTSISITCSTTTNSTSTSSTTRQHNSHATSLATPPAQTSTLLPTLPTQHTWQHAAVRGLSVAAVVALITQCDSALAEGLLREEPANALSLPTWAIHVSSVVEWVVAMGLIWQYAEVSGNQRWKGLTWAMIPSLGGAMCACTWHFFYNSPDLEFLVALQATLTTIGNTTCAIAAYRIYQDAQSTQSP